MSKIIIGIHGLANKPRKSVHAKDWDRSIREGLRVNCKARNPSYGFELVYWADLLYEYPLHSNASKPHDSHYDDEPYYAAKPSKLQKYEDGALDRFRATLGSVVGGWVDSAKEQLGLDPLGDLLLQRVVRDLGFYYDAKQKVKDRNNRMRPARDVLQDDLIKVLEKHNGKEILLIAHSMGSIISYDVLRRLGKEDGGPEVSHFVTVGSPLGLPIVKAHIDKAHKAEVRSPSLVSQSWKNFADRKDPVAFDSHLRDDFAANDKEVRVQDDLILNDYVSPITGKANRHKIYGYLRAPEVSEHIQEFLT